MDKYFSVSYGIGSITEQYFYEPGVSKWSLFQMVGDVDQIEDISEEDVPEGVKKAIEALQED